MRPRRARPILLLLSAFAGAAGGCAATYPLGLTNQGTSPITVELIPFPENENSSPDWATLLDRTPPLRPGQRISWNRSATGVTYLLAIAGPGLRGPRGYVLFSIPAAPMELLIRGDDQHTGVWVDGHPPVLLRP